MRSNICEKRLKDTFGFPKAEVKAQAYWTQGGREMGSTRDDDAPPMPLAETPPSPTTALAPSTVARAHGALRPAKSFSHR